MADDRSTFDIHCEKCGEYLFSGAWERPFRKGDEHLLKEEHYCDKCKAKKKK